MLTDSQIRAAKYDETKARTRLQDINGLYLEVMKSKRKFWRVRAWKDKKERNITLGEYPYMGIAEARAAALEVKHNLKFNKPLKASTARTFRELAEEWLDKKIRGVRVPSHVENIEQRLRNHVLPYIGDTPLDALNPPDMLAVLRRIEKAGIIETAYRVQNVISRILAYGVATAELDHNFMPDLRGALQRRKDVKHFAALTDPADIARFIQGFKDVPSIITRCGLYFNSYTIVRPNELRFARWEDVNFGAALWTIPAERMKMRREHVVPLSRQAVETLERLRPYTGSSRYIFPQSRDFSKPMSECTLLVAIRKILARVGLPEKSMTWHGFRAMASTHLNAKGWSIDAIEKQLAHGSSRDVRLTYNRHDYMDIRREMMQDWADWLDGLHGGSG